MYRKLNFYVVVFALCISCSFATKDRADSAAVGGEESTLPSVQQTPETWSITIRGKVKNPDRTSTIQIQELRNSGEPWSDTIRLRDNNTFVKRVTLSQPGYYKINFFNKQTVDVILFKSDIEVNVDGSAANGTVQVVGSPEIDLIRKVEELRQQGEQSPEVEKLSKDFEAAAKIRDQDKMLTLQQQYLMLLKGTNDKIATLLKDASPSLGVINMLGSQNPVLDRDQYFDAYLEIAKKLEKEWPRYEYAQAFVSAVNSMKSVAIGQPAPEIALPDTTGQVVKLSSFKGKYVLVDFWAKWCGPCRQENPNVVRAFNKYKDKGFTVFGVSLDRNKEDWMQAIRKDGLTWTHVSDLKYWNSEAARLYNINGIPFSVLLDKDGIIIAKNLRGAALEQKLAEILK